MTHPPPSLDFEIATLRDRNAALEDALNGKLGDLLPELRGEIERLREELHYCKGTCELAMKHRDLAEAEVAKHRELIEKAQQALGEGEWTAASDYLFDAMRANWLDEGNECNNS